MKLLSSLPTHLFLAVLIFPASVGQGQPPDPQQVRSLRERIDTLLEDELTKHWYPQSLDKEHGGFHQNFARDWSPRADDNRFLVYQARMTWTAAAFGAYSPNHRDEYLGYARKGIAYLDETMRDRSSGGFHWILNVQGEVDPRLGDEKHVYGTAFVLYAASRVAHVAHDDRSLKVARDTFEWLERHAFDTRDRGYFEAFTRAGKPIHEWDTDAPLSKRVDRLGVYYGFKSMNSHIHLLEALAEFYRVDHGPRSKQRLEETLAIVRDRIAITPGALNLYLTRDWRAIPAHDSFGHDVETAYLLVEAAEILGIPDEPKTWQVARSLIDHALDWGWDAEYGGFYDKGDSFAGEAYDQKKVWWTEAEGLNALLVMHRKFGATNDRYWKAFLKQWDFIEKHLLDGTNGGWYMETTRGGRLIGDGGKATQWKANYHTARAMMNVASMLRDMESKTSGKK